MGKFSLSNLTKENEVKGMCSVLYGEGSSGKTTLLGTLPSIEETVFISGEEGLSILGLENVARTPLVDDWEEFQSILITFVKENHNFKTIVIDTLDSMMPKLEVFVINKYYGGSIEKANSYKAYYSEMYTEFNKVLGVFSKLKDKSINVVPIVHSVVETRRAPDSEEYFFYNLNLGGGKKTSLANALYDYSDNTIFMRRDVTVREGKGVGSTRVLQTAWNPAYLAKSRVSVEDKLLATPEVFQENFLTL